MYRPTVRAADGAAPLGNRGRKNSELSSPAVVLDRHAPPLTLMLGFVCGRKSGGAFRNVESEQGKGKERMSAAESVYCTASRAPNKGRLAHSKLSEKLRLYRQSARGAASCVSDKVFLQMRA